MPDREIISLNGAWNFFVDSTSAGDPTNWSVDGLNGDFIRTVTVPHAWNVEKGMEKYWGKCWYKRDFEISEQQLFKITRLQFDGVYHDALIYINDKKAGEHTGSGYTRFLINITPFLKAGINTITVCVDNSPSPNNIPVEKSFDWANDGGIYRNVSLIITEPQAIRNIHVVGIPDKNKGLAKISIRFLDTTRINASTIQLKATITEENQSTKKCIYDGYLEGNYINGCLNSNLNFDSINPWHFDAPNLYKLTVKLIVNGIERDELTTCFGFRSIKTENYRYVLNGEPIRVIGVEWMPGSSLERGMAETHEDFEKNLELMKNANCIFTRFHWQQDDYIFDWADRNGMLIQEELPIWGAVSITDSLLEIGKRQINEMTDAHYNHPSIISWGIGNEMDSRNETTIDFLKKLNTYVKCLDSSRLVTYASNRLGKNSMNVGAQIPDATGEFDIMMFNEYYSTWFGQSIDSVSKRLDEIAHDYPDKALTISEWGICEPVFTGGDARRAKEMIQQINIYGSKPFIAGAIYFCLNDYRTQMGEDFTYSYPQRVHGVCDIKLNPKPSYDTLKNICSPIIVKEVSQNDGKIVVVLLGKLGLPSYTVRNYSFVAGHEKVKISELMPGEEKTFEIKTNAKEIRIYRAKGFEVMHLKLR
jgi:beta-glucuronidase